jgi:hypothetical protein
MPATKEAPRIKEAHWEATDRDGNFIAEALTLDELDRILIEDLGYPEDQLPPCQRVPEAGNYILIL